MTPLLKLNPSGSVGEIDQVATIPPLLPVVRVEMAASLVNVWSAIVSTAMGSLMVMSNETVAVPPVFTAVMV